MSHFPPAEGVRLDGTPFVLPAGLSAAATLLVVTFQDDAAPISGQWARLAGRIARAVPGLDVVEVSVAPPRMRLLGDLPLLSARSRAEAQGTAGQTAVLYTRRKPFRRALGIANEAGVTAFLVRPDGEVAWRGEGEIDLHEVESLEAAVHGLLAEPPPPSPPAEAAESQ